MKRAFALILTVGILLSACSKAPEPPFEKGSEEYTFFRALADTVGLTVFDPDVNKKLISTSEFNVYTSDIMPALYGGLASFDGKWDQIPVPQVKEFAKQNATGLAEKKLFYAKATDEGFGVADSVVNDQMEQIYKNRGGKEQFISFINERGFDLDYVIEDVKISLTNQNYMDSVVNKNAGVSDDELRNLYEQGKTATVRHILFMTRGKTDEEIAQVQETAQEVAKRAQEGEDFVSLVEQYSEDPGSKDKGGLYEDFARGRMVKAFEDAAFTNPIGSISDPVETQYGYHIIKVEDRTEYEKPFEEVKPELEQQLARPAQMQAREDALQALKDEYDYQEHFEELQ